LRTYDSLVELDPTDLRILGLLRENARRSFQDIGSHVGLSAPAVKRRVDRLERSGVISGYTAIVDPRKLGWTTVAVVEVHCEGRMDADQVRAVVAKHQEVTVAYTVAGLASAIVIVRARDTGHLEATLARIRDADGVLRTQTSVVLSTLLERPFEFGAG
jgi:DNA-binding Lrp family transcriptional regulator